MTNDTGWRPRGMGARWQHASFRILLKLGGRRTAYLVSDLVALWYVLCSPGIRQRCRPYLNRRFPDQQGVRRWLETWRLSREFARALVDRIALIHLGEQEFRTSFLGQERLLGLLAEGKGLIIVTAHVGAWQLGMTNLRVLPGPIALLVHLEADDGEQYFPPSGGAATPFRIIDPAGFLGGIPELLGVLQQGGVVSIMGDRVLGSDSGTVPVPFLGDSLRLPYSPYKLASAMGAPVAVLFSFKPAPNQYELRLAKVIRVPPELGRNPAAYQPYAAEFALALTEFVQEFPHQFFNFYDLWETPDTNRSGVST